MQTGQYDDDYLTEKKQELAILSRLTHNKSKDTIVPDQEDRDC
jgi:hypothetical protein